MRQVFFEEQYRDFWQSFETRLHSLRKRGQARRLSYEETTQFMQDYRTMCHHLALANERHYSLGLSSYLQRLCEEAHALLYVGQNGGLLVKFGRFVREDFPRLVRQEWQVVVLSHALFYLPFLVAFLLVALNHGAMDKLPGLVGGEVIADSYQKMAEAYAEEINRPFEQNILMAAFYIFNNIGIAFRMFAGGLLLGLGTVYAAIMNGWTIGGVMGYMLHQDAGWAFFSFVGAHGAFELTGITIAGAGGLKLAQALLYPRGLSRRDALRIQGSLAIGLMNGAFLMLFIAALLEAFWSPITSIALWVKFPVALSLWLGVYVYLWRAGREKS